MSHSQFYIDDSPNGARYFYYGTLVSREIFEKYAETHCQHVWDHHHVCKHCGKNQKIAVHDCATGAKDSYCVGKVNGAYYSFWNPHGWAGSGYVFYDKVLAEAICDLIRRSQ